jgi:hypothetical protein
LTNYHKYDKFSFLIIKFMEDDRDKNTGGEAELEPLKKEGGLERREMLERLKGIGVGAAAVGAIIGLRQAFKAIGQKEDKTKTGDKDVGKNASDAQAKATEPKPDPAQPTEKPKEMTNTEKYLGRWAGGTNTPNGKNTVNFSATFKKPAAANQPGKDMVINGIEAKLISPLSVYAEYHILRNTWAGSLELKKGDINSIGGIYIINGEHFIVFWAEELKKNIIAKIRTKNNGVQIFLPSANNDPKLKEISNKWINLRK